MVSMLSDAFDDVLFSDVLLRENLSHTSTLIHAVHDGSARRVRERDRESE